MYRVGKVPGTFWLDWDIGREPVSYMSEQENALAQQPA